MKDHPPNPALDEFVRSLEKLRQDCGRPSLRGISRLSRTVAADYRQQYPNLTMLSLATLSNVLNRRRVGPPEWPWVACYVLTCHHYAAHSGLSVPGEAALPEWNRRLQRARGLGERPDPADPAGPAGSGAAAEPPLTGAAGPAAGPLPAPVPVEGEDGRPRGGAGRRGRAPERPGEPAGGESGGGEGSGERGGEGSGEGGGPARERPRGPGLRRSGDRPGRGRRGGPPHRPAGRVTAVPAARTAVAHLLEDYVGEPGVSLTEQRFYRLYGQHGVRLLREAEGRLSADACYRLGILLCIDDRPTESLAWLMQAEKRGDRRATALIEHADPLGPARSAAYAIGRHAADDRDFEIADLYLEKAAQAGHVRAAYALGQLWLRREDAARADYWFTRARELTRARESGQPADRAPVPPPPAPPRPEPQAGRPAPAARPIRLPSLAELIEHAAEGDRRA